MKLISQLLEEQIIQREIVKEMKQLKEMTIMIINLDKKDLVLKKIHQELKIILRENLKSIIIWRRLICQADSTKTCRCMISDKYKHKIIKESVLFIKIFLSITHLTQELKLKTMSQNIP